MLVNDIVYLLWPFDLFMCSVCNYYCYNFYL